MKKLLIANIFLLICLLIFYNLAGFDEIELLFLGGLLLVSQASHFFFLPAVSRLGWGYWVLVSIVWGLMFVCAFSRYFLTFWLMWWSIVGIETTILLVIARLAYFFAGKKETKEEITNASLKILVLTANPVGTMELALEKEVGIMASEIGEADNLKLQAAYSVNMSGLMKKILDKKPHILHFSGHGTQEGILLQNEQQNASELISQEGLSTLFRYFIETEKLDIQVVILNACHSQEQAEIINQYVQCVIGTTKAISDTQAIAFSKGFYLRLARDRQDITKAFEAGVALATNTKGANASDFVLLSKTA